MSENATAYLTLAADRPVAVHTHVGSALAHGRTAGPQGNEQGVVVIAITGDLDGEIQFGAPVISAYLNGLRQWRWGIRPASVRELNEDEKARLIALQKQLGDHLPAPDEPPVEAEEGEVALIWHRHPDQPANTRVVGFVRVVRFADNSVTVSDPEPRIAALREAYPSLPRLHVSQVPLGQTFDLTETSSIYSEPVGLSEMTDAERQAIIDEYVTLARAAGLL